MQCIANIQQSSHRVVPRCARQVDNPRCCQRPQHHGVTKPSVASLMSGSSNCARSPDLARRAATVAWKSPNLEAALARQSPSTPARSDSASATFPATGRASSKSEDDLVVLLGEDPGLRDSAHTVIQGDTGVPDRDTTSPSKPSRHRRRADHATSTHRCRCSRTSPGGHSPQ